MPKPLRIVIDCDGGGSPGGWWPDSHLEGKFSGGSEEQAMYTARELAKLGHIVTVRNDCREHEGIHDGVTYLHYANHSAPECDIYCSQRNKDLVRERKAPVMALLCHDIPQSDHMFTRDEIDHGALDNLDFCILLNEYHRRLYIAHGVPPSKTRVCPIMVPLEPFDTDVERIPGRCVYCSCPTRGLERLMSYWPEIKRRAPHATLQICWRFSIAHDRMCDVDRPWFEQWEGGNEALGVLPLKNCSHDELAWELSKAELLTYPSTFSPEISPAATIKAQIAGAVPLVVIAGGMDDTVRFGHRADFGDFHIAVSNALNDPDWQQKTRDRMVPASRAYYDPARVIAIWDTIIQQAFDRSSHNSRAAGKVRIKTDYPIAYESRDYQHPLGAYWTNGNPDMVRRLFSLRSVSSHLDLGCAGGKFVTEMADAGALSVGVEGTDYPLTNPDSEWHEHPDHFFTADITKPFTITTPRGNLQTFDVITCFEVFEHIAESDLEGVFANINKHARPDSLCVFTASNDASWSFGVDLHVTKQNREWWMEKFAAFGWRQSDLQSQFEEPTDWGGWIGPSTMHFVLERSAV